MSLICVSCHPLHDISKTPNFYRVALNARFIMQCHALILLLYSRDEILMPASGVYCLYKGGGHLLSVARVDDNALAAVVQTRLVPADLAGLGQHPVLVATLQLYHV